MGKFITRVIFFILAVLLVVNESFAKALWPLFELKTGYTVNRISVDSAGGFDYLPNGDAIVIDTSFPPALLIVDANGDRVPARPQQVGSLPAGVFGSFIKVSPDGTFAVYGATGSTNPINKIDLATFAVTTIIPDLFGNFSLAFRDNNSVYISLNASFAPQTPNSILYVDLANPGARKIIININNTPSGPVVVNDAGDLYYVKSTGTRPPPPGSHTLLKFTAVQLQNAINTGTVLAENNSQISMPLDGGYNLAVNSFGDLFVAQLNGEIVKVDEKNLTKQSFCTPTDFPLGGSFSNIAFYQPHKFFNPFEPTGSKLGATFTNSTFTRLAVIELLPAADDVFADLVLSFNPGLGGGGNPSDILGVPFGGGTSNPTSRSLLALGDRDNPASATPATVDVQFNSSILDDARNLHGLDFIVFSNSFWIGGNAQNRFTEPALIEVSQDLNHNGMADDPWFLMVPNILPANLGPLNPVQYYSMTLRNYAENSPTLLLGDTNGDNIIDNPNMKPQDFYTVPDRLSLLGDPQSYLVDNYSGGGDASDLRDAVVQTSPGVPFVDPSGRMRYVYLKQADFIRLRDVRKNDIHPAGAGIVTAEIDALADAKDNLRGTTIVVNNVSQLNSALAAATRGDTIQLNPGVYQLANTMTLPAGVSLKGSNGLWTVNDSSDDVIIQGNNLPSTAAAVFLNDPSGTFSYEQGYEISGLHFENCYIGISAVNLYPTIQNNFFTDVSIAVFLNHTNPSQTVVIRHNVFGHTAAGSALLSGITAAGSKYAAVHNTFVNYLAAGVIQLNAEGYLRDNIFSSNQIGVWTDALGYIYGEYNVFYANATNISGQQNFQNNILFDPSYAKSVLGDYRLNTNSAVRAKGMGGDDPGTYTGLNFFPHDIR